MTDEQTKAPPADDADEEVTYDADGRTDQLDGELRWRYEIVTGLVVHIMKPTDEQLLVLLRMTDIIEDDAQSAIRLYGDALDALILPEEAHRCARWLLKGWVLADEFTKLGVEGVKHWFPGVADQEAPRHGPSARRRRR